MCWNPLLNWFRFNSFHRRVKLEFESLGECGEYDMLTLLPHALHAAQNPSSSIHEILATTRPVNHIVLEFSGEGLSAFISYREYLENKQGITIGQVLATYASNASKYDTLGLPVCLWMPWNMEQRIYVGNPAIEHALCDEMKAIRNRLKEFRILQLRPVKDTEPVSSLQARAVCQWWFRIVEEKDTWFKTSMVEQSRYVKGVLKHQKYLEMLKSEAEGISDDALELSYVAGVVLNRLSSDTA
jgi:hypothetical protein